MNGARMAGPRTAGRRGKFVLTIVLFAAVCALLAAGPIAALVAPSSTPAFPAPLLVVVPTTAGPAPLAPAATSPGFLSPASSTTLLQLSVSASPGQICVAETTSCSAGTGISRVTLTAQAPPAQFLSWPNVQVAFVIENTPYDGVFDPTTGESQNDQCAAANGNAGPLCEESNGVPFFVANAQEIANAIQAANPHSQVSFALVNYFATYDPWDDSDGPEYQVDIPKFIPAAQFGAAVQSSFAANFLISGYRHSDSDLADNILHSSSITALYGAIIGSGLNWSEATHHVIVWMGSTAPRAPGYAQDYWVSSSNHVTPGATTQSVPEFSTTCEPSYSFGDYVSPQCEGWTVSQDSNASHSIAGLARSSPTCTDSIGGVCTVDTIDLWATPTDPMSPGWPAADATPQLQGGPGGAMVEQNVARVLLAGCDLAAATGGTWNGPSFFTCPDGQAGSLQPTFYGSYTSPDTSNPSLLAALRQIGFGPVTSSLVATGTNHPLFTFVPFGAIQVLPGPAAQFRTACLLADGTDSSNCPTQPTVTSLATGPNAYTEELSWNWSTLPRENLMYGGDTWIASFWVMAAGPPYGAVPIDACTTSYCALGGSHSIGGAFTSATYLPNGVAAGSPALVQSFPLGTIVVQPPPSVAPPPTLPPPATAPPPPGIPAPSPLGLLSPVGVGAQVGVASLSLQAAAAGFVAAGFTAVTVRNRPMSIAVAQLAQKSPPVRSRFEESAGASGSGVGRFE